MHNQRSIGIHIVYLNKWKVNCVKTKAVHIQIGLTPQIHMGMLNKDIHGIKDQPMSILLQKNPPRDSDLKRNKANQCLQLNLNHGSNAMHKSQSGYGEDQKGRMRLTPIFSKYTNWHHIWKMKINPLISFQTQIGLWLSIMSKYNSCTYIV